MDCNAFFSRITKHCIDFLSHRCDKNQYPRDNRKSLTDKHDKTNLQATRNQRFLQRIMAHHCPSGSSQCSSICILRNRVEIITSTTSIRAYPKINLLTQQVFHYEIVCNLLVQAALNPFFLQPLSTLWVQFQLFSILYYFL